jgi:transcriptional regulator with XRE-family HTH domain
MKTKLKPTIDRISGIAGPELKARRIALSLTQIELAERLGVDSNTYSRWEQSTMGIGCPVVLRLAMDYLAGVARPVAFPSHRPGAVRGE